MVQGALLTFWLLGAAPVQLEGGSGVEPAAREQARFHGEVSAAAGGAIASPAVGFGPGLHLELGVVLADKLVLSARASIATIVVVGVMQAGISAALALSDRVHLGLGATWALNAGFVPDQAGAASIQFPIRLAFMPSLRTGSQVVRNGLLLGAEVGPGVAYLVAPGYGAGIRPRTPLPAFSLSAMLTIGYAVW